MNYNEEMKKIIKSLNGHNKLLLHSCCGPCSSSVIETLKPYFDITVLYYNPNIEPLDEYLHRKDEQLRLLKELNIKFIDIDYLNEEYHEKIKGYENCPENGERCHLCYELRMDKTAMVAKENNFDYFCTTLTVSPYKNSKIINEIGLKIEEKYHIKYLQSDFKKENGYLKSIELSNKYNLYRQNYCGCLYSKGDIMNKKGFTLVEIVAVICVLALIMIVVVPAVQKSLTNAKTGISNINKKNIEEAAKTLGTEILFCDDESDTELKTNLGVTSCAEAKTDLEATLKVSLGDLEAWGYFSDDSGNCKNDLDKNITILSDENDKITVSLDKDITCKK